MGSSQRIQQAPNDPAADMVSSLPTLVITGDEGFERVVTLLGRDLRIGRSLENDVVLPDARKGVSRTHAELRVDRGTYVIVDLQSQNGTWVNGERVDRAVVPVGAEISIGLYRLQLEAVGEPVCIDIDDIPLRDAPLEIVSPVYPAAPVGPLPASRAGFQKPALVAGGLAAGILVLALVRTFSPWTSGGRSVAGPTVGGRTAPAGVPSLGDAMPSNSVAKLNESTQSVPSPASAQEAAVVATSAAPEASSAGQSPHGRSGQSEDVDPNVAADRRIAREAFAVGNKLDVAGDWVGALHKYDQARLFDPSLPGLDRTTKEVWEKMRVAGRTALNRGREYDAIGQSADAVKEYDKAAQWLPPDDPNRAAASSRAELLRAGIK